MFFFSIFWSIFDFLRLIVLEKLYFRVEEISPTVLPVKISSFLK